jgi:quinol monooxygenase YgiN
LIVVTGHIRLSPQSMDRVRPHMRKVLEATREEPGCILYAFGEDVLDPGLIRIVERWQDWESLEAHGSAPHIQSWRLVLREIGVLERELSAHAAGEERQI